MQLVFTKVLQDQYSHLDAAFSFDVGNGWELNFIFLQQMYTGITINIIIASISNIFDGQLFRFPYVFYFHILWQDGTAPSSYQIMQYWIIQNHMAISMFL